MRALLSDVKNGWKGDIVPEASPKGESRSNGEVERAVQEVQGMTRTLADAFRSLTGVELKPQDPLVAWMVEYAGVLLLLLHKSEDGLTS